MRPQRTIAVLSVAIALVAGGCSPSTSAADGSSPAGGASQSAASDAGTRAQTSDDGQVTVTVEWAGPPAGAEFYVTVDTHAVDLDPLDLADATIRNDRGETMTARQWAAPKGGHHRQGVLSFDGDAQTFLSGSTWIELVILGVGDAPERTLRWSVTT